MADHDVVDDGDADELAHGLQSAREVLVVGRRFGVAARVTVNENHRDGRFADREPEELPGVDEAVGERPLRELDLTLDAVLRVEKDEPEMLESQVS